MVKKVLLISATVLFILLTFITDFGLYLLLAVIMGFITWLLTKTGEHKAGAVFAQVGTAMVIVPFIVMLIVFMIKTYLNPDAVNELASGTIDKMMTFFATKLPFVLLSDVAGAIVGGITGISQR